MSILSWDDMEEQSPSESIIATENTQSIPPVGSGVGVAKAPSLLDQLMQTDDEEDAITANKASENLIPGDADDIGSRPDVMADEERSIADTKMDQIMRDPIAEMRKRCTNPEELAALDYLASMDLMHGAIDTEGDPIQASDKRVIRGASDVNQLIPLKYEWAWQKYLDASANHWMPQEIAMSRDIAMWKSEVGSKDGLTEDERMIIMRALGFFSTADSVVMNNLVKAIYDWITSPEHRQYIATQIKEESIHQHAYQYCIESLGMDQTFVFNMYRKVPSMTLKSAWCIKHTLSSDRHDYDNEDAYDKAMIKNMVSQYIVMEGIFFYCGFASVLSMGRRNKMPGVCEQFQYILRDESVHLNFGVDTINQIRIENPELFDAQLMADIKQMIISGTLLEIAFAYDTAPRGILGYNASSMEDYLKFIADRRLEQLGIAPFFNIKNNPFQWMSEMMDLRKEKNFFETRVTDYQTGGALSF